MTVAFNSRNFIFSLTQAWSHNSSKKEKEEYLVLTCGQPSGGGEEKQMVSSLLLMYVHIYIKSIYGVDIRTDF